jgi:hypothetical protein
MTAGGDVKDTEPPPAFFDCTFFFGEVVCWSSSIAATRLLRRSIRLLEGTHHPLTQPSPTYNDHDDDDEEEV